jgi:two-component system cell cycle sensor histidine kinase/response regulator CckA
MSARMSEGVQGAKLLVVSAEAKVAEELGLRLDGLGGRVLGALTNGEEAVEAARRLAPDVVLMAVDLDGAMSGVDAAARIWRELGLPVILLSGHVDLELLQRAKECNSFGFVLEPFETVDLVATLELALYRHGLERRLEESEKRYAATLASIGDGVISTDRSRRITFMNPVAEALTGFQLAEARGRSLNDVLCVVASLAEDAEPAPEIAAAGNGAAARIASLSARDGSLVPVELIATSISGGAPEGDLGSVVIFRDISRRLTVEQELRKSEQRFRRLFEDMDEGVAINEAVHDAQGEVVDYLVQAANPAFEQHAPYRIADTVGKLATEAYALPSEYIRQWWAAHAPLKRAAHTELWHEPTGQWFHVVASPITDGTFATFFTNITARKRAEEALRHSEQRFRAIFDHTFQFIGLLDAAGTVIEANRTALEFADVSEPDVVGKPFWETAWWSHAVELQTRLREAVGRAAAGHFVRMEVTHPGPDGSLHTIDFSLKPVRDEAGQVVLLISEGRDITERKQAEDALRRVEAERRELEARVGHAQKLEAIGSLAAGVAHDFNNILTVVAGCCDLLLATDSLGPSDRSIVEEILAAGKKGSRLTNQLLVFSRRQVLQPKQLDLRKLVADTKQLLARLLGEDIVLSERVASDLWPIQVDPGQVEQVIINLAVNARDAMPRGGDLWLEARNVVVTRQGEHEERGVAAGRYVLLSVRDSGTGIAEDVKSRVFEPFFTTKEVGKGTGLGLATVYGIVQQSGGVISVESEVDRGACFHIYFPALASAEVDALPTASDFVARPHGREAILVVEDDASVRAVTSGALRKQGYTVFEAGDGLEALRLFAERAKDIQLIVTDVVMPGLSGREMVEAARNINPAVGVLYVSGYPDDAILRHGILRGEVAFLQKPFSLAVLAEQVRSLLDEQRLGPIALQSFVM